MFGILSKVVARQRGAATTEKLVLVLFGVLIIVPMLMLFGPVLQHKMALAVSMLGGPAPDSIAAREARPASTNTLLYVVLFSGISLAFSTVFVFPLLFRRLRIRRQVIINELAERFPFLEPLSDRSLEFERNMNELKDLANEVRDIEPPRANALQVAAPDLGRSASPADVTMSNDMLALPDRNLNEQTVPREALRLDAAGRVTPSSGLQPIYSTPSSGVQAIRSTPRGGLPAANSGSVADAWAPSPSPQAQNHAQRPIVAQPEGAQSGRQVKAADPRFFDIPDLGPLVNDDENAPTVDISDPSLLTSLPMSAFRDRKVEQYDPDQTVMPSRSDIERTLPKKRKPQDPLRMSADITSDWDQNSDD